MRRQSRENKSKGVRQSSIGQKSRIKSKRTTFNDSSFVFSEIPRAAILPQSSGEIAFNKIISSKSNLFEPATSQCDYLQFQQNQQGNHQRFFDDKSSLENSSKKEKFWRVLERNNDDGSMNSSDIDSSDQLERTSRRHHLQQERSQSQRNPEINFQEKLDQLQPQDPTQLYDSGKEQEIAGKKHNLFSISNRQVDFKVTPKKEIKRQLIRDNQITDPNVTVLIDRAVDGPTAEKRMNPVPVQRKKQPKRTFLHERMESRIRAPDNEWVCDLKYFDWDEAQFLHPQPRKNRKSYLSFRKTRISPLKFWMGQRIVYKKNGKDGVWINIKQ